jgi:hypothetical protein
MIATIVGGWAVGIAHEVSVKELQNLRIATLEHGQDLIVCPMIQINGPDLARLHTKRPVLAGTAQTKQTSVTDGCPGWIGCAAIDTMMIAGQAAHQFATGHGKSIGSTMCATYTARADSWSEQL